MNPPSKPPHKLTVDDSGAIELAQFVPYQISVLSHRIARRTTDIAMTEAGLNLSCWRVLAAIAEQPGRTANEVVAVTPMDKGIVSRAVKRLLGMALVTRRASAADGRVAHLHLTAKGKRDYQRVAQRIRPLESELLATLPTADRERMSGLIQQLLAALPEEPA